MNKKTKRVGNANLYIGLAYHKRKSYPRDSHGFEPLDQYFNKDIERDTTSPETDVEELIRQERTKKKATEKEQEVAKKKALEEEERARRAALQQQDAIRVQVTHPAPIQRPHIIVDSSDSDTDDAEQLELLRKLAGLATTKNNKAPPTSHVPMPTAVPVIASAPLLAGAVLAAQGGAKISVEATQRNEREREPDRHSSEELYKSQPGGDTRVVNPAISQPEDRELRSPQEPPSVRQRKSVGAKPVAEERSNTEPEQSRPRGRPPRKAPGDESDEGSKSESSHRSQQEVANGNAAGTVSETAKLDVSKESTSKRLRVRKSLVDAGEEKSNHELEQGRRRGRPSKRVVQRESNDVDKHDDESPQDKETSGNAAGNLTEVAVPEDSQDVASERVRVRHSSVGVGEEQNSEPEQTRRRGRPKKVVESEPSEVDKHTIESSQQEEASVAVVRTMSEGTALEDLASKRLRSNPEPEQGKRRGRPPKKAAESKPGEVDKHTAESSQQEGANVAAAGSLSEGTALENCQEVANNRLRPKKSLAGVVEVQNPEPELGRPRGRPPRKAPGDESDEGSKQSSESSQRSQQEGVSGDAAGNIALEGSQEMATKILRTKDSLVGVDEEQNPKLEQGKRRGRPPKKAESEPRGRPPKRAVESESNDVDKPNNESPRQEGASGDAEGTLSEGTALEDSQEVASNRSKVRKSLVDVGEEQSDSRTKQGRPRGRPRKDPVGGSDESDSRTEQGRPRGRPRKDPVGGPDEVNKQNSESSHRSQQNEVKSMNVMVSRCRAPKTSVVVDNESREYTTSSRTYTLPLKPSSSPKKSSKQQSESSEVNKRNISERQDTLEKRQTRRSAPSDMSFVPQATSTLERRLRSVAKEREKEQEELEEEEDEEEEDEEDEEDEEEENVMDTQEAEDQREAEDAQGDMVDEVHGNGLGDSDEGASGNEQEATIVRRLFRSPRESKSLEKSRQPSELPSGSERSGAKGSASTKTQSAPPSAKKRKKRWSVVPPALKRMKKALPSALQRLKKAAGVEVNDTDLLNVTNIGGMKYHRVPIKPREDFTPGVRRGHRTRIPRLEPDEIVDYDQWFDPKTLTGPSVVSVLVPAERTPKPRQKATSNQQLTGDEYPPVPIHDDAGNVIDEERIMFTPASAEKVNSVGQPVEESPDGVRITKYFAGDNTSNGLITLDGLAEKSKSKASRYDLFFCVMKGKVLVTVNSVPYTLFRHFGIRVPQGALYSVQNLTHSVADLYYYISKVVPGNTAGSVSE